MAILFSWPSDEPYQVTTVNLDDNISIPRAGQTLTTAHSEFHFFVLRSILEYNFSIVVVLVFSYFH